MDFNFKLERVLNFKENIEQIKKAEFGSVQQKFHLEEEKLKKINDHKKEITRKENSLKRKGKIGQLSMVNNYILNLENRIKDQKDKLTETSLELDRAREEMKLAVQEKKTLEKLKEREYEEHLYKVKKDEEKLVDTIVNYRTSTKK